METKKWTCPVLLIFILLGLSASLLLQDSPDVQPSLTRELKSMDDEENQILHISTTYEWLKNLVRVGRGEASNDDDVITATIPDNFVLSPNLSTCHTGTQLGDPVYCCPPKRESEEPFIEFKFPSSSLPTRLRRPAHLVDDEFISKYNKAYSIMKSLPYDDPRSFMRQADIHCLYCTGSYNQLHYNSLLNVHRSWLFFPWHRMYIYFHERILGKLIGDDTFALPFWNWDSPIGMVIPNIYMNGSLFDVEREASHLPPHVVDGNFRDVESGLGVEEQIATNLALLYNQMVSSAKKTELFMGCPLKAGEEVNCNWGGSLEQAPHGSIHYWVGSKLNPNGEDMSAAYAAARDPIFYAHHSNVDRLWEVWKELEGYKREISDPAWLASHFFFYDENAQLVRVKIQDILDINKLKYSYEKVDLPWLHARPKPSVSPKIARSILSMRDNQNGLQLPSYIESANFGPEGRNLDTTIRVRVYRPNTSRTKEEKEKEEEVLVVYGIDIKKDMHFKLDVFVNAVDERSIGPESREFAGTFVNVHPGVTIVLKEGDVATKTKSTLKLGISEVLEDLEADGDDSIWVSLVPRFGIGANSAKIDGIRIEYMA